MSKAKAIALPMTAQGGLALLSAEAHYKGAMELGITGSDEELASRVQAGESEAFGTLVERYENKLRRYGRKFLARQEEIEDIVQDVFESAFRNINSFDTSRRFSPWVFRIAHNAFVNALRRNKLAPFLVFDFDTLLAHGEDEASPDLEREQREMRQLLDRGMEKLSPAGREILILFYLEDFSYQEIADILHVPTGTVGVRLSRARDQLRKIYKDLDVQYE